MLGYTRKGYKFNGAGTKNLAITKLGMYNPTQIVTASLEDGVIDFGKSDMTVAAPIRDHVMLAQGFLKGFVKSYTVASKYCGSSVLAVEYLMAAYNHVLLTGSDK